jgi:hypothetical protein
MTFTELCNEVYLLTNRPDLVAETQTAVKAATLKAHQSDFYYKDLYEVGVSFPDSDYVQSLEYKQIIPTWRALKYIRKSDAGGNTGKFLTVLTPEETIDSYGANREDVCYVAGAVVQIKSSTQLQYIFLGCYVNPSIVIGSYNSWVAADHPYCIVFDAVATIFKMIGFDEQAVMYRNMVTEQLAELRISNIQAEGY